MRNSFLFFLILLLLLSTSSIYAQSFPISPIPLDIQNGGRSISTKALKAGDIIVSTTDQNISKAIRLVTKSEVSHAILYIGDNKVIESIEEGVSERKIEDALKDAIPNKK